MPLPFNLLYVMPGRIIEAERLCLVYGLITKATFQARQDPASFCASFLNESLKEFYRLMNGDD